MNRPRKEQGAPQADGLSQVEPKGLGPTGFDPSRDDVWASAAIIREPCGELGLWLCGGVSGEEALGGIMRRVPEGSTMVAQQTKVIVRARDSALAASSETTARPSPNPSEAHHD